MMNDNENPIFDAQAKVMQRRSAFAAVFREWPHVLVGFARTVGLGYAGEKTREAEEGAMHLMNAPDFPARVIQCLAGQFAVQLIRTRVQMEVETEGNPALLILFGAECLGRLEALHAQRLGVYSLHAAPSREKVLRSYNAELAEIIFTSLAADAQRPDFDEAKFWADLFRGIGDGARGVVIPQALSLVVLDHLDQLRHVFRAMEGGHALDLHTTHH